ncbi:RNase H domain-containing protein [Trichonephila clavipes]|uniref:RNase H domain-containing protein n=1 Tax=Trichonephila clavipes TaxID=2585209 RepID=A0A8X7BHY3_TRICX|nr:RNase H domain-containing protein [Trichonephila clavipes]
MRVLMNADSQIILSRLHILMLISSKNLMIGVQALVLGLPLVLWRQTFNIGKDNLQGTHEKKASLSELIDISGALDHALNSYKDSIWFLTDSRSSIQYLKNWPKIMDSTGLDILFKLASLGQRKQVHLQWTPSHVGVPGNDAADELAGIGVVISLTPIPQS